MMLDKHATKQVGKYNLFCLVFDLLSWVLPPAFCLILSSPFSWFLSFTYIHTDTYRHTHRLAKRTCLWGCACDWFVRESRTCGKNGRTPRLKHAKAKKALRYRYLSLVAAFSFNFSLFCLFCLFFFPAFLVVVCSLPLGQHASLRCIWNSLWYVSCGV